MDLTGKWKAFGNSFRSDRTIEIKGDEISFWVEYGKEEPKLRKEKFTLRKDTSYMGGDNSYDILIENDEYRREDYMVHEEDINGKTVQIISKMDMEYDGRGRIVIASYVKEEDLSLVDDDFVSKAVKRWNQRPSTPMTFQGVINNPAMISMMTFNGMNMPATMTAASEKTETDTKEDPWKCSCGAANNSGKFCPQCGATRPRA